MNRQTRERLVSIVLSHSWTKTETHIVRKINWLLCVQVSWFHKLMLVVSISLALTVIETQVNVKPNHLITRQSLISQISSIWIVQPRWSAIENSGDQTNKQMNWHSPEYSKPAKRNKVMDYLKITELLKCRKTIWIKNMSQNYCPNKSE